jgi:ribosomal protein L35AE/L33A
MDSASLTVGKLYAFREKRQPGVPFLKVKLLAKVGRGGKVQVRFEDGPFPGAALEGALILARAQRNSEPLDTVERFFASRAPDPRRA